VDPSPLELRHRVVVEFRRPLGGSVTLAAIASKLALVFVVLLVAVVALAFAELVVAVDMTIDARDGLVLAFERKALVVELLAAGRIEMQER
jgi:hypothetical protein